MKQTILLTGSAGFIIGNLVRKLSYLTMKDPANFPYKLVSIDKFKNNEANSYYSNKNHALHIADLCDAHIVDTIFQYEKPDIIIHGAAYTHVDESIKDPNVFITNNILATQNLLNSAVKHKTKRFIQISTDEIYGQLNSEDEDSWKEENSMNPRNTYATTKASAELLVKAMNQTHGLEYNITRSSNNYGPRQSSDKLIPKVIKSIIEKQPIPIYGQGLQIRDWTYVSDNCDAIIKIMQSAPANETYNIAANQEFSNIEVVNKICNIIGEGADLITFVKDRLGHDFRYSVNCDKIKKLGWKPNVKFSDGLEETIGFYLNNKWLLK